MNKHKLTAKQMAARRAWRREIINTVPCPTCGAGIGFACLRDILSLRTRSARKSPHISRVRLYHSIPKEYLPCALPAKPVSKT